MSCLLKFVSLAVFVIMSYCVQAQYFEDNEGIFYKLTIESGLSQNKVNAIFRDTHGYVWFGTGNGLNRFDGKNIQVVQDDTKERFNLVGDEVFDFLEDESGDIWIAAVSGLYRYCYKDESITYFILGVDQDTQPVVNCLEKEDDKSFWVGTNHGLFLFNRLTGDVLEEYKRLPYEPYSISNNGVYSVCNVGNELWIGTRSGLNIFNKGSKSFSRYESGSSTNNALAIDAIRKIIQDKSGDIWIGTESGGLFLYRRNEKSFQNFSTENSAIPHDDIRDIFDLKNGKLWLATNGGGLSLLDKQKLEFTNYRYDPLNMNGLSNNSIYTVLEDNEGILWLGFYAGGVNYNASEINDFKLITHLPGNKNSICESNARSLFLDADENLWIGTLGGVSFYDKNSRSYTHFKSNMSDSGSLSFNTITCILKDRRSNVWVGTYSGGVNLLKPHTNKFIHFKHSKDDPASIPGSNVYSIVEDGVGNVWVGTSLGLNVYDGAKGVWRQVTRNYIRDIIYVGDNKLYIAAGTTILLFDIALWQVKAFENEIISSPISVLLYDEKKNGIWFGSQGDGLGFLDLNTKEFTNFLIKDGLPNDFVASIEPYGDKYLWIGTYRGLSLFDKENLQFVNYGMTDGLHFLEFYPKSSVILPDSSIAFGGTKGVLVFHPQELISGKSKSKLQFSSLKIDGNKVGINTPGSPLKKSIQLTDKVALKYAQNDFAFEFVDINFKNRGLGNYAYMLENYMDSWNKLGDQNQVSFTNMDPGDYVLRVRKLGGDTQRGFTDEIRMEVEIIPPFWMTWYFYLLVFFLFVLILFLYSKYTLISISQKNEIRLKNLEYEKHEEFNALRMKFFTYISHELRTPLSLIVDPLNRLLAKNKDVDNIKYLKLIESNSDRMMKLVNQILDFRKLENDTLNLQVSKNKIKSIVSKIFSDFEETAINKKINYHFDCLLDSETEGWVDADKLEKIIYNLLSNAFKFVRDEGEVALILDLSDSKEKIKILISDNGYGIEPDKLDNIFDSYYSDEKMARNYRGGVGIGLSYVKRLVDLHHGQIMVGSELNKGTTFVVEIPIQADSYTSEEFNRQVLQDTDKNVAQDLKHIEIESNLPIHGPDVPLVLVVEDEVDLRKYLCFLLGEKFRVEPAVNGQDALEKLENLMPDLILCDNVMPVMDGIEFCNQLKNKEEVSHIPFIFLSAWNSDDFKLQGLTVGADDYLSKPFDSDLLVTKISNIIEKRRKFKEIAGKLLRVSPTKVTIETSDERFILRAQEVIENNMDNLDFTTKQFEDQLSMSHSVVYRKIKSLTGLSSNEFIREYRIRRAAQIISQDKNLSVMEVSLMVGFNDQKYFSRCFKKVLGVSPSEYKPEK